ncbi:MAG TPA: hypothetical protein VFA04_08380 [Bryobacteraceae bacterium]|nr:hypothetical protein [Bryobacteraceae bacterium]
MKRLVLAFFATCTMMMAQPQMFYGRCTADILRGTYIASYAGFITSGPVSAYVTLFGVVWIDPGKEQNIGGAVTVTGLGPTPIFIPTSGKAVINPDCTGTLSLGAAGGPPTEIDQFIYDIYSATLVATTVRIQAGSVASLGTWKKISLMPRDVTWPAPPAT